MYDTALKNLNRDKVLTVNGSEDTEKEKDENRTGRDKSLFLALSPYKHGDMYGYVSVCV